MNGNGNMKAPMLWNPKEAEKALGLLSKIKRELDEVTPHVFNSEVSDAIKDILVKIKTGNVGELVACKTPADIMEEYHVLDKLVALTAHYSNMDHMSHDYTGHALATAQLYAALRELSEQTKEVKVDYSFLPEARFPWM